MLIHSKFKVAVEPMFLEMTLAVRPSTGTAKPQRPQLTTNPLIPGRLECISTDQILVMMIMVMNNLQTLLRRSVVAGRLHAAAVMPLHHTSIRNSNKGIPALHTKGRRYAAAAPPILDDVEEEVKAQVTTEPKRARPTRLEAEDAVRTLLEWIGDDPERQGLLDTPARVVRAYEEFFGGYDIDPTIYLERTFEEIEDYDEMVVLRDIRVESFCEHHMAPIIGRIHVAYMPDRRVVGISKLARVCEIYAKRLQIQEKLTAQIANTIQKVLQPKGVAVVMDATHHCMTTRGIHKTGVSMVTSHMIGEFRHNKATRQEFFSIVNGSRGEG